LLDNGGITFEEVGLTLAIFANYDVNMGVEIVDNLSFV
jgi:hypothetical protein